MGRPQFQELGMQAKSPNINAGAIHPCSEAVGRDHRILYAAVQRRWDELRAGNAQVQASFQPCAYGNRKRAIPRSSSSLASPMPCSKKGGRQDELLVLMRWFLRRK